MDKEKVLGFNVSIDKEENLLDRIFIDYKNYEQLFIVNINPEIVINNYKNSEFKAMLNKQKYQIPDGSGIVWASKKNNGKIKQRITGIDLMQKICEKSQEYTAKIYLYGATSENIENAKKELQKKYSKINIVGTCNGYEQENKVVEKIIKSNADIVFVGLGSPKQENFIIQNKEKLKNVRIFMPVGGSFDVISKAKKRAPNWMIKCNIEWLYRLLQEPKRIFRQYKLLKFIYFVNKAKIKNKASNKKKVK